MRRFTILTLVTLLLVTIVLSGNAQNPSGPIPETWVAGPSFGFGVSIPWLLTPNLTTAITFLDTFVEVPLTLDLASRTTVRYYVSSTGLNLHLTSGQQSLLYFLNRGPVRLYQGAGVGVFPYEIQGTPGFLLELHYLAGLKFNTSFFSLFGEVMYEIMPQPVTIAGILSNLDFTIGGQIHFCPACVFACASLQKPQPPAPCTPPC